MQTTQELKKLSDKELGDELKKSLNETIVLKMQIHNGTSKETSRLKALRKYVARIRTIQRETVKK